MLNNISKLVKQTSCNTNTYNANHYNNSGNNTNNQRSRSKSIYRGNQLHTTSMHLKIDCDMSPETIKQSKQHQKAHKQMFKENIYKGQKLRQSLKMTEGGYSAKKSQRQIKDHLDPNKQTKNMNVSMLLRQPQTERFLKQATNTSLMTKKQSNNYRHEKTTITLVSNKKQTKNNLVQNQQVAITQQQLKQILTAMKHLEIQNKKLKKQLEVHTNLPKSSVSRALKMRFN